MIRSAARIIPRPRGLAIAHRAASLSTNLDHRADQQAALREIATVQPPMPKASQPPRPLDGQHDSVSLVAFVRHTLGSFGRALGRNQKLLVQLGLWLTTVSIGMQVDRTREETQQAGMLSAARQRALEEEIVDARASHETKPAAAVPLETQGNNGGSRPLII